MLMHREDGDSRAFACTSSEIPRARYTSRDFLAPEYDRIVGGGWFAYRARPNGWDPSTAIFEHWTMEELPAGMEWPATVEQVVRDDYRAHDWGTVLNQDFSNFGAVQKGLENPDGPPLLWNPRQEACVRRFHEIIDDHLFGEASAA